MSSRTRLLLAWTGGIALTVLHLAPWFEPRPRLVLGVLPEELAYRLGWMVLAFAYLVWFTASVWREEDGA
ncbi:MAG: hypothetical protein AAF957_10095 [Planctomycetota bacterium]